MNDAISKQAVVVWLTEVAAREELLSNSMMSALHKLKHSIYRDSSILVIEEIQSGKFDLSPSGEVDRLQPVLADIKDLLGAWNFRMIAEESLESYEQGVLLELVDLCEKAVALSQSPEPSGTEQVREYIKDLKENGREYDKDRQQLCGAMKVAQMMGIDLKVESQG